MFLRCKGNYYLHLYCHALTKICIISSLIISGFFLGLYVSHN